MLGCWLAAAGLATAAEAGFFRGLNLNGPALMVDGKSWESGAEAPNFKAKGKTFENQQVPLRPPTDISRARMIRSSVWGSTVELELSDVPSGVYQVFLYVWEDNHNEKFDLLVNGKTVVTGFNSGSAGMWKRLGPWLAESLEGKLSITARGASHGAANLSGLEVWAGDGAVPDPGQAAFADDPTPEQLAFFESKIRPVLIENCYECHSASAQKLRGGLLLDSRAGVRQGGDTGPVIAPGDPDASLLIQAVRRLSEDLAMPPKKKLAPEVVADLEAWVKMGAPDPRQTDTAAAVKARQAIDWDKAREWWAFRPLIASAPPAVNAREWPANDIDRFILARLETAGLAPAPGADRRALIRRATYDLTGLPPTPEDITAFVNDTAPDAFARVIDRLLESPRYGERWGRHWLDVVRYADTAGDNSDFPIPQMSYYRDWVIDAFNRDLPYDQFVRDQLAGDLVGGEGQERLARIVATGYIANARRFGSRVDDYPQHLTIEDTLDNIGRTFLGLTVSCARCHDHKFDPITAQDYYALYGILHSTRYPWPGIELEKRQRDFVPLVAPDKLGEVQAAKEARRQEESRREKEIKRLKDSLKETPEPDKKAVQDQIKAAEKALAEERKKPFPFRMAYAVADASTIGDAAVQLKGDPAKPGPVVSRRFLTVFGGQPVPGEDSSSGRARLAAWILESPLAARVMANRIWLHHFGRGIVPTANDFGKQGKPPTHPELLDFLAAQFRDRGWSVKEMHRLIMLSRTYQLGTARGEEAMGRDPSNELLSAFPRRRLEAEAIRDTLLVLGENLDLTPCPEHPFPPESEWEFTQHNPFKAVYESNRRSVFLMTQRIQRHPYLAVFDGADPSTSTPARSMSTTPLQALYLLNDPFVHEQSKRLAQRVLRHSQDEHGRVQHAHELLFARPAARHELDAARTFLEEARALVGGTIDARDQVELDAWSAYVRVLFRLNEFVYLD